MFASSQLRLHWQYEVGSPLFCSQSLTMLFCAPAGYTELAGDVGLGDGAGLPPWHAVTPKVPARPSAVIARTFFISISSLHSLEKVMVGLHCEQQARWPVTRVRAGS
jgi:hypothetical protein